MYVHVLHTLYLCFVYRYMYVDSYSKLMYVHICGWHWYTWLVCARITLLLHCILNGCATQNKKRKVNDIVSHEMLLKKKSWKRKIITTCIYYVSNVQVMIMFSTVINIIQIEYDDAFVLVWILFVIQSKLFTVCDVAGGGGGVELGKKGRLR